ncbi:MAG: hypothetical protein K2X82_14890 [Gemmataceae bacterium]|nr:hypothetical protein [Gemmataceae bacterium]
MPDPGTDYLRSVLAAAEAPCVSLYLATNKSYPDNQRDAAKYRDMVRAAEDALKTGYPGQDIRDLTAKLHWLADDAPFWAAAAGRGVAVLASPARFDTLYLPRNQSERVEVGATFHVKPLIRHVQSADPFHVLGVSRERCALFEGNRDELHPVEVPGVPFTQAEAQLQATDRTRPNPRTDGPGGGGTAHPTDPNAGVAPGMATANVVADTTEFYRAVDREVLGRVSNRAGLSVILIGIPDNTGAFRHVSKNRFLLPDEVRIDWTHLTLNEIRAKAWPVWEKHYLERLKTVREDYGTAASRGKGTADIAEAGPAAVAGRIGTLLVDADRTLPGALDMATGEARPAAAADAQPGDLLDDLAELVLKTGGTVTVVPADQMPTPTGLAAIFRY